MWGYSLENCMIRCLGDPSCHGIEEWTGNHTSCNVCTGLGDLRPYVITSVGRSNRISVYRLRNKISYLASCLS